MEKRFFLLADDDLDDREIFAEALTSIDMNIECHYTEDGREALTSLKSLPQKPNVIFLDINMPVRDGWQCLKVLKSDEDLKNIPVIIISTSSHQSQRDMAQNLGAHGYFIKASNFEVLKSALRGIAVGIDNGLPEALLRLQAECSNLFSFTQKN